ncbi:glycoside hydrolase family 2 TIM barrel-domain containing protein [Paenibacillus puldeungensis]|uniref:Glycoside hydrolase family 2 TIM barrel-domain containing protein n=1 Tax=Paenibacillus puldeungensis TaxID=696536 RepID=A0ABW3S1J9_9BACL
MNKKTLFNDGWTFAKTSLEISNSAGLDFKPVDLPHDWLIYNTLDLYENSIGWYRKVWTWLTRENEGTLQQFLLYFDGVYMDSSVYVNGKLVGEWKYGYSSFEHDITQALTPGENEIVVKVVHQSPNSRWYSGAGIYRNVWLKSRGPNYIVADGIYVTTKQEEDHWRVEIDTELNLVCDAYLAHSVVKEGRQIATVSEKVRSEKVTVGSDGGAVNRQALIVINPALWSPDEPNLYQLITELHLAEPGQEGQHSGEAVEVLSQNIGFRTIQLDPNQGLLLNGRKLKLNGVCEHHDLGAFGAAFNRTALARRFKLLKEMGANAIRTAHNMPAKELMELADEMGLLVVSEAFDMWERAKTPHDYARFFTDWYRKDVKSWIKRDRNHPSLLLWSIGNEIYDTHADERGQSVTKMLMEEVMKYDPKQNARVTIGSNYMPWENAQKCADIVKVAGYNYAEALYERHHKEHPDWIIYGSETASVVQSRGIYHFPFEKSILADDDEQCSSLGNSTTSWGAKSAEACIISDRDAPYSLGQFIWTGFDYIGEPTPYHTKNSYFGQIDTATFPKDSYYIYQAAWTDYRKNPMVHLFPYWDFNDGQMIDVRVCSNAPRVELRLDGKTIGAEDIDHKQGDQLVGWWKIPYTAGELQAIAYDEAGRIIATDVRSSFGDAKAIRLRADKGELTANGMDLVFVEIGVEDENGCTVENANNRMHVQVTGAGRLLGLDNGDSTDYDPYKGRSRRLFGGKLMAIIGATLEPGDIRLDVSSLGMESQTMHFKVIEVPDMTAIQGVSAAMNNEDLLSVIGNAEELPLRKIELISEDGHQFGPEKKQIAVRTVLHPSETSYSEIDWAVVNEMGIESNLAKVEPDGHLAIVTALGDGEFRIRCTSTNGTDKTKLISQLEFRASGIGSVFKDPYRFISAGLYEYSVGEVGNGNEKGVSTSRDGETQVGFRDIDFGPHGSDTLTIPIFALSSEAYTLQIWEGMPDEAGSLPLADVIYQKEAKWNVYQEETYRLSKKLRGVTSLCFVFHQKVHIKGFSFESPNRAFELNNAADCDRIYGDSFTIKDKWIEDIGNNVSLEFGQMDFGDGGASKIIIYGRTPLDKNIIQIRFASGEGESSQMVEFAQVDGYIEQVFELDKITGHQQVTFLFLPGSRFDFGWFRFLEA